MAVTDPIADMLTRIRNGYQALHADVVVPWSKLKEAIGAILVAEGYVQGCVTENGALRVTLKDYKGKPTVSGLKRISRPGRRVYVGAEDIPRVQNGLGICIVSTSQGIFDGVQAKEKKVGGELLCEIW